MHGPLPGGALLLAVGRLHSAVIYTALNCELDDEVFAHGEVLV